MPNSHGPQKGTRHKLQNNAREGGMSPPQQSVEQFEEGQKVHLKIDPSIQEGRFHPRFNGQTGIIVGEQGAAYQVQINDGGKEKKLIAKPAHLTAQE